MPRLDRVIPATLDTEIVRRLGAGETAETIAAELSARLGKKIHGRRVREIREKHSSAIARALEVASETRGAVGPQVEALALNANLVIDEMVRLGTVDIGQAFDKDGKLLALEKMPADVRRAISGIEFDEAGAVKRIRLHEKTAALVPLMRHLGLFEKDNRQLGKSFSELVRAAQRKRESR